jgi:hypothetical protein
MDDKEEEGCSLSFGGTQLVFIYVFFLMTNDSVPLSAVLISR